MQKRNLYSLLLISFIVVCAYSLSLAVTDSVKFESKNSARCANGTSNVTAYVTDSVSAVEIVFEIKSTAGGATFSPYTVSWSPLLTKFTAPGERIIDLSQADGTLPDTIRMAAMLLTPSNGALPAGAHELARVNFKASDVCNGTVSMVGVSYNYTGNQTCAFGCGLAIPEIKTQFVKASDNKTMLPATVTDGVITILNNAPTIAAIPPASVHFGTTYTGAAVGSDLDLPNGCEVIKYFKVSGPSDLNVDANTGAISWLTTKADLCVNHVVVKVQDKCGASVNTAFDICVYNIPPVITCPTGITQIVLGDTAHAQVTATDSDAGPKPLIYNLISFNGPGTLTVNPATGAVTWPTMNNNIAYLGTFTAVVSVSDSATLCPPCNTANADTCSLQISVAWGMLKIAKIHDAYLGSYVNVPVLLGTNYPIGGFDLLIQYDPSALTFTKATEGGFLTGCKWEYFTYRFGAFGNCGNGCPNGFIRLVGIAETNNGAFHPLCNATWGIGNPVDSVLANLEFLLSSNRGFQCSYLAVNFFWFDCGDNTFSNLKGDSLLISRNVYDYYGSGGLDTYTLIGTPATNATFPTNLGANHSCEHKNLPGKPDTWRIIDFFNGGVDVICDTAIDARGDINLNGIKNEIADAVMFTNYFIQGLGAFLGHPQGSIAAADINNDGTSLTVADLVYLIRVIVGDALPYPKLAAANANWVHADNGAVTVDSKLGGAFIVAKGNVTPTQVAMNMDMKFGYDAVNNVTRILIAPSPDGSKGLDGFSGHFVDVPSEIVSIEFSTVEGAMVTAKLVPTSYALSQNYPNPFNPSTKIDFALPVAGNYDLAIYNVNGQLVKSFTGTSEAGYVSVEWNAAGMASGVYFYRLSAGSFTATKKMVLLK